jgi:TrmH family RNA methyltransferase
MFQLLSRSEERLIRALHRRKEREAEGLFLAEGVRVVEELLASGLEIRLAVVSPALDASERGRHLLAELGQRTAVRQVDDRTLTALAGTQTPQGLLAVARTPRTRLAELEIPAAATILILDGVQDPGNFGTLVRTADALGAAALITLPGTVDPWNAKSVRATAGAAFRIPIVEGEVDTLLGWLREQGFTIYGAAAGGVDASQAEFANRAALIVGNEGAGLSPAARNAADALLAVPIEPHAESLNVAVAAGILLFLLTRRT